MNDNPALPRVLCVDDEPGVLSALKRAFRHHSFAVTCTNSPSDALRILNEDEYAVVVSDYQMPDMSGVEFLYFVNEAHPQTKRILLTGEANTEAVVSAVNDGGIHKFFVKPWDNSELANAIAECVNLHSLEQENRELNRQLQAANDALNSLNMDLTTRLVTTVTQRDKKDFFDSETDLPNEKSFLKTISEHLDNAGDMQLNSNKSLVLIALSILDSATLEQGLGANGLSDAICCVSNCLKSAIRDHDLLARVRTETFVLATWFDGDEASIFEFANRLVQISTHPRDKDKRRFHIATCAGVSIHKHHGDNANELLENAIAAMNKARSPGHPNVCFFDRSEREHTSSMLSLINDLHVAIEANELFLEYQPRIDILSGRVVAAEALLRWRSADRGFVSPAEFVPLLERVGLIETVGEWAIQQACGMAKKLAEQKSPLLIAVNISAQHFQSGLLHQSVSRFAGEVGISPHEFLELEITESTLVSDMAQTRDTIHKLQALGVKLAIDDFGTGYSSFSYLAELPADYVKIDRSFINALPEDHRNLSVVKSIISVASSLQMRVIAEGIETEQQAVLLKELGCNEIQGYYYSGAVSEAELLEIARNGLIPKQASAGSG